MGELGHPKIVKAESISGIRANFDLTWRYPGGNINMVSCDKNQALEGIIVVNENDIICGRSGLALKHPGNAAYRKIVGLNKELYATCLKTEKLRISKSVVAAIREIKGRFLEREDGKTSLSLDEKDEDGNPVKWRDIGDKRAIEKTSQALREGQPKLLRKLAEQQKEGTVHQMAGINSMAMNGHINHVDIAPQPHKLPQLGHLQTSPKDMRDNFSQIQGAKHMYAHRSVQNAFQAQEQPNMPNQESPSFAVASMVDGETFNTFPRNSFENNLDDMRNVSREQELRHDSWGPEKRAPLHVDDPIPFPYIRGGEQIHTDGHVFSADDHQQLMTCLGVEGGKFENNRPSVKFQLEVQRHSISAMSFTSIFSPDALSLDSAMDAAQREAEFDMLGEFDLCYHREMPVVTLESPILPGSTHDDAARPRRSTSSSRSILRKSNKWTTQAAAFPPASLNHHVDPGMIFTCTMDTKPGGVNSGTDVSGLLGERRNSVVAFELDVNRRRSSRMSMCSAMTDVSGMFKRDVGSVLSIHSADFRELMADISGDDDDSIESKLP